MGEMRLRSTDCRDNSSPLVASIRNKGCQTLRGMRVSHPERAQADLAGRLGVRLTSSTAPTDPAGTMLALRCVRRPAVRRKGAPTGGRSAVTEISCV